MKWGKPTIWLCNKDPREEAYPPNARPDFDWMEKNVDFIEVTSSLISHANTE